MAGDDDNYILDVDGKRVLIGLSLDETVEFERLDEAILDSASKGADESRSRDERRWLVLHDKHDAALRNYIAIENAQALRALRWEWADPASRHRRRSS
jgi:hypothetical protein